MLTKDVAHLEDITAADSTELREILHPGRDDVGLRYSLAHAVVRPGERSLPHSLATTEVYYILSGTGMMHVGDEKRKVHPGVTVYIPPDRLQWIENTGGVDLAFLCIVDPAWRQEDERVAG